MGGDSSGRRPEHGIRERTGGVEPTSRDTRPDRATRFIETSHGILSYSEIAPLLAERVLLVETSIYCGKFENRTLDELLAAEFYAGWTSRAWPLLRRRSRIAKPISTLWRRRTALIGDHSPPYGRHVSLPPLPSPVPNFECGDMSPLSARATCRPSPYFRQRICDPGRAAHTTFPDRTEAPHSTIVQENRENSRTGTIYHAPGKSAGNIPVRETLNMKITTSGHLGETIRAERKRLGISQRDLAMTCGTGLRFIVDLEKGKPTCQIGKTLLVLQMLGFSVVLANQEQVECGGKA